MKHSFLDAEGRDSSRMYEVIKERLLHNPHPLDCINTDQQ
jgi:hypothetical protein